MGLIKKLDTKKSADMYEISPKLIKIAAERIIKHLSLIFNCRNEQGIFPEKLKVAFIYPIHKGKLKLDCSNYRPISILPLLSKIYEKPMHTRLMDFISKLDITFKHQYGFQKGKSTEHAILDLYFNIITANEKQEKSAFIFLLHVNDNCVSHQ